MFSKLERCAELEKIKCYYLVYTAFKIDYPYNRMSNKNGNNHKSAIPYCKIGIKIYSNIPH